MTLNRENVTWQSADGTWSRGFFDFHRTGSWDDDDYDEEWGVEYTNAFNWVSTGHPSADSANDAWNGANPGSDTVIPYSAGDTSETDEYDLQAALLARSAPHAAHGPAKAVPIRYLAERAYVDRATDAINRSAGYAAVGRNEWESELSERLRTASHEEREQVKSTADHAVWLLRDAFEKMQSLAGRGSRRYDPYAARQRRERIASVEAELQALERDVEHALSTQPRQAGRLASGEPPAQRARASEQAAGASWRGKTSPKSTAGSFAPKGNSAPEVSL